MKEYKGFYIIKSNYGNDFTILGCAGTVLDGYFATPQDAINKIETVLVNKTVNTVTV